MRMNLLRCLYNSDHRRVCTTMQKQPMRDQHPQEQALSSQCTNLLPMQYS